ncbi:MAG: polyamine aminopropyltransferase [Nitrososphaerota archaeon]
MGENKESWIWFIEWQTPELAVMHKIKNVIYSGYTKYQKIEIVEIDPFGICLILDGKIQSSIIDEYIYHESLVHPALITHPNPKEVLVIGGGEGTTIREVLKHNIKKVTMVDLDKEVVELCKKYIPEIHKNSFFDERVILEFNDGREFLKKSKEKTYDVIIVDVTDPIEAGPSQLLYTKEFYELAKSRLKEDGLIVTQASSIFYSKNVFSIIFNTIRKVFKIARAYYAWIPSYNSCWGFVIGSNVYDPLKIDIKELSILIKNRINGNLRFYNEKMHYALFSLPPELKEFLEKEEKLSTDDNPPIMPA